MPDLDELVEALGLVSRKNSDDEGISRLQQRVRLEEALAALAVKPPRFERGDYVRNKLGEFSNSRMASRAVLFKEYLPEPLAVVDRITDPSDMFGSQAPHRFDCVVCCVMSGTYSEFYANTEYLELVGED